MRLFAKRLGLLLGSIVFVLLLCEAGFRVVGFFKDVDYTLYRKELTNTGRHPPALFTPEGQLVAGARAVVTTSDYSVVYKINSKGFRDKEYTLKKPEGLVRAIALGDSFTFGEGVSYGERFVDIPEARFSNLEVINFAIPGLGLDHALALYLMRGQPYKPDYVFFFLGSSMAERQSTKTEFGKPIDITDKASAVRWFEKRYSKAAQAAIRGEAPGRYLKRKEVEALGESGWLTRHSYFLSYLSYQLTVWTLRRKLEDKDRKLWAVGGKNFDSLRKSKPKPKRQRVYWELYSVAVLDRMALLAKQHGFKLVIINIDPHWDVSFMKRYRKRGALLIDLGPALAERGKTHPLRFKYDTHFNAATNRFMGQKLVERLGAAIPKLRR